MVAVDHTKVGSICTNNTQLKQEHIRKIEEVGNSLQLTADLYKANIFIDCLTKDEKHAIVVAESSPTTANSLYKKPVVGKMVYEAFEPAVFQALRTGKSMFANRALTQEGIPVEQNVVPIRADDEQIIGALIMEKDISDQLAGDQELDSLSQAAESLSNVLIGITEDRPIIPEIIEEAIFFVEHNGNLLYFNKTASNLISSLSGMKCRYGIGIQEYLPWLKEILHYPEKLTVREVQLSKKTFEVKKIFLAHADRYNGIILTIRDITELREKEKQLVMKSVAIQEIHHRVKNNLQTIASLLRLQMRRGLPDESKHHFYDSLNRIQSIASVYEIILANRSIDEVNVGNLTEKIGNMLIHDTINIKIKYQGINISIDSKRAVSVALVVNELIQNSLKHAFPGNEAGEITVTFYCERDMLSVEVTDNGVGYVPKTGSSLGLDIVEMVSKHDLGGEFVINQIERGTVARVTFPREKEGMQ